MKWLIVALTMLLPSLAQANIQHRHYHAKHHHIAIHHSTNHTRYSHHQYHRRHDRSTVAVNDNSRPAAWCGWYMRQLKGGGPELNLARNWAKVGHAVSAQIGAIVVWVHHVGLITGKAANGQWIVKSGNDGHAVRERPRSLSGAIAFRMT